ncbi:unnamed protein product, partial [Nesidiocoris tenuis]
MRLPEGYPPGVCKLNKSLYGLKQSPMCWNEKLKSTLKKFGLQPTKNESCLFVNDTKTLMLAIHIDDGLLIGKRNDEMNKFLHDLQQDFDLTYTYQPTKYLGMEIIKKTGLIKLSQESYLQSVLERYGMENTKSAATPMMTGSSTLEEQQRSDGQFPYRECVGSLLYLSNKTRPDVAYAISFASRHMENPTRQDVANVKRTLKYLSGSSSAGIQYQWDGNDRLVAYSDADFANDPETRKSTTGYVISYCGGPISWASRKQSVVATSTTEAEFIAAADCSKELLFLKSLILELTGAQVDADLIIDNMSAIHLIKNGIMNRRSKHIE